jgi:ribonuclease HII
MEKAMENSNKEQENFFNFSDMSFTQIKFYVDTLKSTCSSTLDFGVLTKASEILKLDKRKNVQGLSDKIMNFIDSYCKEIERVKLMYCFDKQYTGNSLLAGVDEVGRGPLAGPIVAGAVIIDLNPAKDSDLLLGIKDSKKLSCKLREELSQIIKSKAIAYSIGLLGNNTIDNRGIAWCNNEIFKIAVSDLKEKPNLVLSDGYPIKNINFKNNYVVKGDEKSASIACASIIAKVYRDNLMKDYAKLYPQYGFEQNAGYGTKDHIEAIKKYGPCEIHRRCFLNNII